jgi:hypothetical protein
MVPTVLHAGALGLDEVSVLGPAGVLLWWLVRRHASRGRSDVRSRRLRRTGT